ncbi:MAG TPA: hypothetical protein VG917_01620 [Patescibacteria group bacterium]|nr:hypothetical protein [Patescibacteria group bacterium]
MSAEHYFDINLNGEDFTKNISVRREREVGRSPINIMANDMISEGIMGISDVGRKTPNVSFDVNSGMVLFGEGLIAIERMIWDREFNLSEIQADMMRKGSAYDVRFTFPTSEGPVAISDAEWTKMRDAAVKDKTLACFYEDTTLLPEVARRFVTRDMTKLRTIREKILPKYKTLAIQVCK